MKRTAITDSLLIFVLGSILIWPLFRLKYMDNWSSIESTFISDARMLSEHLPHPGWQPLWYCGTRFDYIYPPALRYGTALIASVGHLTTARAYHLYSAFFYVFGFVAVYWMVRIGTRSRQAGFLASAATALVSPSFLFLSQIRWNSGFHVPQRLHVLMAYGEGPHISSLCVLPAAMAAAFVALRGRNRAALAAAAVLCALAVSNNFYGAMGLAIFFPVMVWSVWNGERDWKVWLRAAAITVLTYGLTAFWLTPSYLRLTASNLHWVTEPDGDVSYLPMAIILVAFCIVSARLAGRRKELEWTVFVAGAAALLAVDVFGFYAFGIRTVGNARRLIPELDLALVLAIVEMTRRWRAATIVTMVAVVALSLPYLQHAWSPFPKSGAIQSEYPYQINRWLHDHLPSERTLSTGEVRFWSDAWFDNFQMDGGSMQGMENQIIPVATWQIATGDRADLAVAWLRALGAAAIVVPDANSREYYRQDYVHPDKFRGALPALYDDGHGTVIYGVPRVHPGIGRIVDAKAIPAAASIPDGNDLDGLTKYLAVVEKDQAPVTVTWRGFDLAVVQARTERGQSVLLQETFDPAWHAYENGKPLSVRPEVVMGFTLIDVPEGDHMIQMRFETPLENRVGQLLSAVSLLAAVALVVL